jgi:uncharacterized protein YbjT (DUF2867 family)
MPSATILRPSVVFGLEDQFFNRFGRMAELLPVMPVLAPATKLQPVFVGDVADAIMAGIDRADTPGGLYELGGPRVFTMRALMEWILKITYRHRPLFTVSDGLAHLQASLGEMLPGKPFTRDQLAMLARDNVVSPDAKGLVDLGIEPVPVDLIVPDYMQQYRPGGGKRQVTDLWEKIPNRT